MKGTGIFNMERYLLKTDIQKAFDSNDYYFVLAILEKYGYKKNLLRWIETLLNNQELQLIISNLMILTWNNLSFNEKIH